MFFFDVGGGLWVVVSESDVGVVVGALCGEGLPVAEVSRGGSVCEFKHF